MLAKNVNGNACFLDKRGACEFFASKLAPTEGDDRAHIKNPASAGFFMGYFLRPSFFSSSSRNSRRKILPTLVVGNASRNSTALGTL